MVLEEDGGPTGEEMTEGLAVHGKKCGFYSWYKGNSRIANGMFLGRVNRSHA